jgi:hypothetical protein
MSDVVDDSAFDRAVDAMARQKWEEAYSLLSSADRNQQLAPDNLSVLAEAAYFAGHPEVSREAWERIHGAALRDRDSDGAARCSPGVRAPHRRGPLLAVSCLGLSSGTASPRPAGVDPRAWTAARRPTQGEAVL